MMLSILDGPLCLMQLLRVLICRKFVLSGRQFTWANRRAIPTYEKLDRVLASVEWEQKFPLVSVRALSRSGSDHTPLLIDLGSKAHRGNTTRFSFELSWFEQDGFDELVATDWAAGPISKTPMQIWKNKIRAYIIIKRI
jgi:hypothetical protein